MRVCSENWKWAVVGGVGENLEKRAEPRREEGFEAEYSGVDSAGAPGVSQVPRALTDKRAHIAVRVSVAHSSVGYASVAWRSGASAHRESLVRETGGGEAGGPRFVCLQQERVDGVARHVAPAAWREVGTGCTCNVILLREENCG